jgi:hypothetical protein
MFVELLFIFEEIFAGYLVTFHGNIIYLEGKELFLKLSYQFNMIFLDGKELFFKHFILVSNSNIGLVAWKLIFSHLLRNTN